MTTSELIDKIKKFEQVGVMRALIFLQEGTKTTREFEEVISLPTFIKGARQVLVDLGLIKVEEGMRQSLNHSLTEKGKEVAEILSKLIISLD